MRRSTITALILSLLAPAAAFSDVPAPVPAPALQAGDTWVFDRSHEEGANSFTQGRWDFTVERPGSDMMVVGLKRDGAPTGYQDHMVGADWSQRRIVDGVETVTGRPFRFPLKVGDTWSADYTDPRQHGFQTSAQFHTTYKVVGWEDVTVPAGTFRALKVEANGTADGKIDVPASAVSGTLASTTSGTTMSHVQAAQSRVVHHITYGAFYYVPSIKYYVKRLEEQYNGENVRTTRDIDVLVSFKSGDGAPSPKASE